MQVQIQDCKVNIDFEKTRTYESAISLCDCPCCRNFYLQAAEKFPAATAFLSQLGVSIARPDELGSVADEDEIAYLFAAYTVCGTIVGDRDCTLHLRDGDTNLDVVIGVGADVPNEQTDDYFVVTVYNMRLPWRLEEPFPEPIPAKGGIRAKISGWIKSLRP